MIAKARGLHLGERCELTASMMDTWLDLGDGSRRVELEIGFGKGRYLLQRALEHPETSYLGIEIVSFYFRLVGRRAQRRNLANVRLLHAEALYALSCLLPQGFADVVHVYHPDPWPKARHHKRRLFDVESLDLLLRALKPGGELLFASDHAQYADLVEKLLCEHPALDIESLDAWPDGLRTHYEEKFTQQGVPIRRLVATLRDPADRIHPQGRLGLTSAWSPPIDYSDLLEGASATA